MHSDGKADIDVMDGIFFCLHLINLGIYPSSIKEPNETKVSRSVLN